MAGTAFTAGQREELLDAIIQQHPELARERTLLVQFLNAKGWAETTLEVFGYLNLIKAGGVLARLQGILGALSLPGLSELCFIIDTLEKIGGANLYAVRMLGRKAYAYGATAWTFGHAMPPLPAADARRLEQWQGARRASLGAAEWRQMGDSAMTAMLRRCIEGRIHAADFKLLVRLSANNQPKLLAGSIYRGLQAGMSRFEQEAHETLRCDYPD